MLTVVPLVSLPCVLLPPPFLLLLPSSPSSSSSSSSSSLHPSLFLPLLLLPLLPVLPLPPPPPPPQVISSVQDLLVPETVNVMLISKRFANECRETEKWYGTKYSSAGTLIQYCNTPYSVRMSPENIHKLMGFCMEVLILGFSIVFSRVSAHSFLMIPCKWIVCGAHPHFWPSISSAHGRLLERKRYMVSASLSCFL